MLLNIELVKILPSSTNPSYLNLASPTTLKLPNRFSMARTSVRKAPINMRHSYSRQHLSRPPLNPNATPFTPRTSITVADHVNGWKKAKERTSPGKSGLHFGMYKAHLKRPVLAALDASMGSIAYMTGFAYKRWKKQVVDVALLKRRKDFRAEKLRTIALMEADFNMNNKALGNDTMKAGNLSGSSPGQCNYGGRHGHLAWLVGDPSSNHTVHKKKVSYHFILKKNCETNFFRREPSSAES